MEVAGDSSWYLDSAALCHEQQLDLTPLEKEETKKYK